MTSLDGRRLLLPDGWQPVEDSMFSTALERTKEAFEYAADNLARYYDPDGPFSGATFLGVPSDDNAITAADLWAVSTLSMRVPPRTGRALLSGELGESVTTKLRQIPADLMLHEATAIHLKDMGDLQDLVRKGLPALGSRPTNQWVFAAKLWARKRPLLFPVRDAKVCVHLAGRPMGRTQLGYFSRDIQVFAYLVSHPWVRGRLDRIRAEFLDAHPTWSIDRHDLRLLDVVLWTRANA